MLLHCVYDDSVMDPVCARRLIKTYFLRIVGTEICTRCEISAGRLCSHDCAYFLQTMFCGKPWYESTCTATYLHSFTLVVSTLESVFLSDDTQSNYWNCVSSVSEDDLTNDAHYYS